MEPMANEQKRQERDDALLQNQDGDRNRFLRLLCHLARGSSRTPVKWPALGEGLGLTYDESRSIAGDLVESGLAAWFDVEHVSITLPGIEEVSRQFEDEAVTRAASPGPAGPQNDLEKFRAKLDALTEQEIEDGLARNIYGPHTGWKTVTALNILRKKRQQETERRQAERDARRESGEVEALNDRITVRESELRDKRTAFWYDRRTFAVAVVGLILGNVHSWRNEIVTLVKWLLRAFSTH